jgi:hypothetical protein
MKFPNRGAVSTLLPLALGSAWIVFALLKVVGSPSATDASWAPTVGLAAVFAETFVGVGLIVGAGRVAALSAVLLPLALLGYGVLIEGWMEFPTCACLGPISLSFFPRLALLGVMLMVGGAVLHRQSQPLL